MLWLEKIISCLSKKATKELIGTADQRLFLVWTKF